MTGWISPLACFAFAALASDRAVADAAAGDACARDLSPVGLSIYRAAAPDLHRDTNIPDLLRAKVRPMVEAGQIDRAKGRPEAEAAGHCLQALRR